MWGEERRIQGESWVLRGPRWMATDVASLKQKGWVGQSRCNCPDPPLLPLDPWTPMKRLLSTTVLLTLPQRMRPECPRIQSLFLGDQSVVLLPVPAVATMGSQPILRATSASASFRLASVTNVSSSCEYTVQGEGEGDSPSNG